MILSSPMRGRGLKLLPDVSMGSNILPSSPMRGRGLKHDGSPTILKAFRVVPHAGAWIETCQGRASCQ